mgnify:CR=1 FL=1
MVSSRFEVARVFGKTVVAKLIRQKKYRKDLTDFVDSLRSSKNCRDRQMYLAIAQAAFIMHADLHAVLRGCSTSFLRDVYAQFGRRQRRAYT